MKHSLFFKVDLLLCSVWALFVLRLWVSNSLTSFCLDEATEFPKWTFPLVAYTVLMRLNISFMMLRKERYGWLPALICLLCGILCYNVLPDAVMAEAQKDMYRYSMIAVNYAFSPRWITTELPPYSCWKIWNLFLPIWLWLMPLLYFIVLQSSKVVLGITPKRRLCNGLYIWNDPLRNCFFMFGSLFLVAWSTGIIMNEWLSLGVMLLLPVCGYYYYLNRINKRQVFWIEYLCIILSAGCFWYAQYVVDNSRNICLVLSALLVLIPITSFASKKKEFVNAVLTFVFMGLLLPSFCLGYDIYTVKQAVRKQNYRDEMCISGVLIVEDKDGKVGLRDRYRLIVPTKYVDVKPYRFPMVRVNRNGDWITYNTGNAGYAKGDYSLLKPNQKNMRIKIFADVQ